MATKKGSLGSEGARRATAEASEVRVERGRSCGCCVAKISTASPGT